MISILFKGTKHCKKLKSQSFLQFFFWQTIHRIFLKLEPCFIDVSVEYKNHLPTFSDPSPFLLSLSKLALLKTFLEVVNSPKPKRYMRNQNTIWILNLRNSSYSTTSRISL